MTAGFNNVVRETAILSFPICLGFAATMPTLFATFLDSRWQPGVVAAQLIELTVIPLTFYYCSTAVLLAGRQLHLEFVEFRSIDRRPAVNSSYRRAIRD